MQDEGAHTTRARAERRDARVHVKKNRVHARIRLASTGVGRRAAPNRSAPRCAGPPGPAARFSKHRKVMKYRERRAKLLMRRGPV